MSKAVCTNLGYTETFTSPDGREWTLLQDIESLFGAKLSQGGEEAAEAMHMTQGLWTIAPCKQFAGLHRTRNVYVGIGECGPNGHLKRFRT